MLFAAFKLRPFDRLLVGAPGELVGAVETRLHPYVRERCVGRLQLDVEHATLDEVRRHAAVAAEDWARQREREALDRLAAGVGRGDRGAAGLADVLEALNQARVETLLLAPGLEASGFRDPRRPAVGHRRRRAPTGRRRGRVRGREGARAGRERARRPLPRRPRAARRDRRRPEVLASAGFAYGPRLIVVDYQNDFARPDGALAVDGGEAIAGAVNALARSADFALVVATRDWHPPDHDSFTAQGGPWPVHCVAGTPGAELHPALDRAAVDVVLETGKTAGEEGYSGFEGTGLAELLREHDVDAVTVVGLATDYCVKHTALDAARAGLAVTVPLAAVRAVDVEPGDAERALEELRAAGATVE